MGGFGRPWILLDRTVMSKRPVHQVRYGFLKGTIWKNQTRAGEMFHVTIVRLFKNGSKWQESHHFGRDDLLLAAKVCDACHTWIFEHGSTREERTSAATAIE
jgi:hypothetical protein